MAGVTSLAVDYGNDNDDDDDENYEDKDAREHSHNWTHEVWGRGQQFS